MQSESFDNAIYENCELYSRGKMKTVKFALEQVVKAFP